MFLNNFLIKENKTQYKNDMTIVPRILFSPRMEFFNVNFSVLGTLIINQHPEIPVQFMAEFICKKIVTVSFLTVLIQTGRSWSKLDAHLHDIKCTRWSN